MLRRCVVKLMTTLWPVSTEIYQRSISRRRIQEKRKKASEWSTCRLSYCKNTAMRATSGSVSSFSNLPGKGTVSEQADNVSDCKLLCLCCVTRYSFCRAFLVTLNELNDYAGQHEVIAENLMSQIITELARYTQELKTERKSVSYLIRSAQQTTPLIPSFFCCSLSSGEMWSTYFSIGKKW